MLRSLKNRIWLLLFLFTLPALAQPLVGRAVVDGDTLEIRGVTVRLWSEGYFPTLRG